MKLHFLGANRQVTGSRYCLETPHARILIDCGLFQEREFSSRNWERCPMDASSIDAVVLTHAHIDHCGLLPRLVKEGFEGPVYCTRPTADLTDVMLRDAAHIQMEDAKYKRKRHEREGRKSPHGYDPLYDDADAERTLKMVQGVPYAKPTEIADGVHIHFRDAGHILGSSSVEVQVHVPTKGDYKVVFSGDIGQWGKPLIRDPTLVESADFLVIESTYGDRLHRDEGDIETQLKDVINDTAQRGGKVVIPTFAVERSQELMYHIGGLVHRDLIPDMPVFLDSPMAVDVTDIFHRHRDAYDAETWQRIAAGVPPLRFPGLTMSRTTAQSKAINRLDGPAIIMSTSGMCTAGRIKHHLRANIGDAAATVLFVGYQGRGTLGRLIVEGREEVRIHGREYQVRAKVAQLHGFSGHADREDLLRWHAALNPVPKQIFVTHGEERAANGLADTLRETGSKVTVPDYQDVHKLI